MSVVTSQAAAGGVPGMASDQQTFCCQQGGSGLGQRGDGQVTIFFLLPGMSAAGGVAGRMARCQKQPFRRVKKQAQLGEAAHRAWQRDFADRLPNKHIITKQLYVIYRSIFNNEISWFKPEFVCFSHHKELCETATGQCLYILLKSKVDWGKNLSHWKIQNLWVCKYFSFKKI